MNFGESGYASEQALIEKALILAYQNTTYRVFIRGESIDIRIGHRQFRLDELLSGNPGHSFPHSIPGRVGLLANLSGTGRFSENLMSWALNGIPEWAFPTGATGRLRRAFWLRALLSLGRFASGTNSVRMRLSAAKEGKRLASSWFHERLFEAIS